MKRFLLLLLPLMFTGCAVKTAPPVAIPIPPEKTESALQDFSKVKSGIAESIKTNSQLDDKLQEQKQNVLDQKISITEAISQAEKIKDKTIANQTVTEIEATNLVNNLKQVETRNIFLETQNDQLMKINKDQSTVLSVTKLGADDTEVKLRNKEQEANVLRDQNTFLSKNLTDKNKESEDLKTALSKEKQISATALVYKHWIIILVSAYAAWLIIKNILMVYFPLTKFRI